MRQKIEQRARSPGTAVEIREAVQVGRNSFGKYVDSMAEKIHQFRKYRGLVMEYRNVKSRWPLMILEQARKPSKDGNLEPSTRAPCSRTNKIDYTGTQ